MKKEIETEECEFLEIKDLYDTNKSKPIGIIYGVLECFADKLLDNEIFLSESDFQFDFAQRVKDMGATDIILEYPILTKCLYEKNKKFFNNIKNSIMKAYSKAKGKSKCLECTDYERCTDCYRKKIFESDRTFIDLRFIYKNREYFVEFKYKLSDKDINDYVCRYKESNKFIIKNQGAHNIGRHEIYEDIERMEQIRFLKPEAYSFVVLITNDSQYWRLNGDEMNKKASKYVDYKLGAKIKNDCNNNKIPSYRKIIQCTQNCENNKGLEYNSKRSIFLNYKYDINWANFKQIGDTFFKVLVIDCNQPK